MVGSLLPSQSWQNFTAEGDPLGLRCNLFFNTFCIYYLMAFDYCRYFKSPVGLWITFEDRGNAAQAKRSCACCTLSLELQIFALNFKDKHVLVLFHPTPYDLNELKSILHLPTMQSICRKWPSTRLICIPKILHLVLILQNSMRQYVKNL